MEHIMPAGHHFRICIRGKCKSVLLNKEDSGKKITGDGNRR